MEKQTERDYENQGKKMNIEIFYNNINIVYIESINSRCINDEDNFVNCKWWLILYVRRKKNIHQSKTY